MLQTLFTNPLLFLIFVVSLVIVLTIHEFAHALIADHLGDATPRTMGRLTLNPIAHLDPLGTLALFLVGFGWGKPVPIDLYNLRSPRRDSALISLAGPVSNLSLALILSLFYHFLSLPFLVQALFTTLIGLNIMLAVFNLVPVAPLDGEKILAGLLPHDLAQAYSEVMHQYGTMILLLLLIPFSGTSAIATLISPAINFLTNLLI